MVSTRAITVGIDGDFLDGLLGRDDNEGGGDGEVDVHGVFRRGEVVRMLRLKCGEAMGQPNGVVLGYLYGCTHMALR